MWKYNGKVWDRESYPNAYGFVYLITCKVTKKKYIGCKTLHSHRRVPVKGSVRRRRVTKESDWRTYYGSSEELKKDVETMGSDNFSREILHVCYNKAQLHYLEAKEQFDRGVLLSDDYYNAWISVKVRKSNLLTSGKDGADCR